MRWHIRCRIVNRLVTMNLLNLNVYYTIKFILFLLRELRQLFKSVVLLLYLDKTFMVCKCNL